MPADRPDATLALAVRELTIAIAAPASAPGDHDTRQRAADQALGIAHRLAGTDRDADPPLPIGLTSARIVALDVIVFAGVEPEQAKRAVRQGAGKLQFADPPSRLSPPWGTSRSRPDR